MVQLQNGHKLKLVFDRVQLKDPYFLVYYINDLPEGLTLKTKLFANHNSIFSVVRDSISTSVFHIAMIYYLKLLFNPGASKHAQETIFSRNTKNSFHSNINFNKMPSKKNTQKHLGSFLDIVLLFQNK